MDGSSKERVRLAMRSGWDATVELPDRVPVFCQLSVGHYFLRAGLEPFDIWFRSEGYAEALVRLADRYEFDGILVNLPGRDPEFERYAARVDKRETETVVEWTNGHRTVLPRDDCPHYLDAGGRRTFVSFDGLNPDDLYYVEPWDLTGVACPYRWGFEEAPRSPEDFFPEYHLDTLRCVLESRGAALSVHSEVFSPFSQLLELLDYENGLMALVDDPQRVHACLARLTEGTIDLARRQAALGVDAVLISSAFAGGGFLSRDHYAEFVVPYERCIVEEIRSGPPETPVYTHTCGKIGDRLERMLETGTRGIDTLDPPPLGTVDLSEAKRVLAGRAFIKGNLDPVHCLLEGDAKRVRRDAEERIRVGAPGGGYILSSACSVPPAAPPENLELLVEVAETYGRYGTGAWT
jgi:hypothetical protein